jgi:anti-sigma B factor antagonist
MNAATRTNKGITIVDVAGAIDFGSSPGLRKTLLNALKGTKQLAVNLAAVNYIGSSGIASLLEVLKEANETQKRLVLFGVTIQVHEVLELSRLTKVFEIVETEEQVFIS